MTLGRSVYDARLDRVRSEMDQASIDAVVVVEPPSVLYLCGYWTILTNSSPQALIVTSKHVSLVIPALEAEVARNLTVQGLEVVGYRNYELTMQGRVQQTRRFPEALRGVLRNSGARTIATEHDGVRATTQLVLEELAPGRIVDCSPLLRELRAAKDESEVAQIRRAAAIAAEAMIEARAHCTSGATEAELAGLISEVIWSNGGRATHIVVGTGERGAVAHPLPTERKIEEGVGTVFDIGVLYGGYWAEIARTIAVGEPKNPFALWHTAVAEALAAASAKLAPGVVAGDVDRAARSILAHYGFDDASFNHAAGHGVGVLGMDVPLIGPGSTDRLPENATVTLEPGIYLPGTGGLRIEETFLVTGHGVEILTRAVPTALA